MYFDISPLRFFELGFSSQNLPIPSELCEFDCDWYKKSYGVSPFLSAVIFKLLHDKQLVPDNGTHPKNQFLPSHLLWTLAFIKQYKASKVISKSFGVSTPTYEKTVWKTLGMIAQLTPYVVSVQELCLSVYYWSSIHFIF